jgi:putative membrane protein
MHEDRKGRSDMTVTLSEENRDRLNQLVSEAEKHADCQIVLAVVQRSDNYTELPWKGFALGTAVTGLLLLVANSWLFQWALQIMILFTVAAMLAGGVLTALLCVFWPGFAVCFLSVHRAETEVRQYAESLFLTRELFATKRRTGILLLISRFERQVILLPDTGIKGRLNEADQQAIIAGMIPMLRRNQVAQALETGVEKLMERLGKGATGSYDNELSDEIIEEKGV